MPWIANYGEAYVEQMTLGTPPAADPAADSAADSAAKPAAESGGDAATGPVVCISITEPGRVARLPKGFAAVLRLGFQDYDSRHPHPDSAVLFDARMAAQLVRFARKHRGSNIVVHCAAGISRSGAVVEALLEAFREYEDCGWPRYPNGHVKTILKRALGLVPIGWEEPVRYESPGEDTITEKENP